MLTGAPWCSLGLAEPVCGSQTLPGAPWGFLGLSNSLGLRSVVTIVAPIMKSNIKHFELRNGIQCKQEREIMLHASKYVMLCLAISVWYAAFVAGSFKRYDVISTRYKLLRYILRVASKYGMHLRTSTSCDATDVEVASRYVMVCVASAKDYATHSASTIFYAPSYKQPQFMCECILLCHTCCK